MNNFFAKRGNTGGETKKTVAHVNEHIPWVEKYRPKKVDELVFQEEVVAVLQKVIDGADLPHMLFYGPPGTGKTSAAVALCRQLFRTSEAYKDRVLEMNASDERGIAVVRTRIKDFAHRAVGGSSIGGYAAALKVVILDEADAMTSAAQAALRRTMEKYSATTRFFLICNYVSRIIDPLTSRCAKFRFKPLPMDVQLGRVREVAAAEGVEADEEALSTLIEQCEGDLRRSITTLQALSATKRLTVHDVQSMGGRIADDDVLSLMTAIRSLSDDALISAMESFRRSGHGVGQLIFQLYDLLLSHEELSDFQKAIIFDNMAVSEYRLQDGGNEQIQLFNLAFCIQEQFRQCDN